jgi:nitrogen fixation/metabolism regulation signal transduction histidine kinase
LVEAAGRVSGGDLDARVEADTGPEEIRALSNAFNMMTSELQLQQAALKAASLDAESRRQFIETVLSGVSAGVVSLDERGKVSAVNRRAVTLLGLPDDALGVDLIQLAPEFATVMEALQESRPDTDVEVDIMREGETRRLLAHCGLSWADACLSFHTNSAPVSTPSAAQVRRPIYADSVARWKRHAEVLEPVRYFFEQSGIAVD